MTTKKEKVRNNEIQKKNQNDLRELEQLYCDGQVDNLLEKIEKEKEKVISKMIEYADKHNEPVKWDKEGNEIAYKVNLNPYVISNYFFKSIVPIASKEPIYNAEKLSLVYNYYCDLVAGVNEHIGNYPSSLAGFCKFAGITTGTLRGYKMSSDYSLRIIANKIYDDISDENITLSQMGKARERTTIFKMKSQNELVEKPRTNVNVNVDVRPDYSNIEEQLNKYKQFIDEK